MNIGVGLRCRIFEVYIQDLTGLRIYFVDEILRLLSTSRDQNAEQQEKQSISLLMALTFLDLLPMQRYGVEDPDKKYHVSTG